MPLHFTQASYNNIKTHLGVLGYLPMGTFLKLGIPGKPDHTHSKLKFQFACVLNLYQLV